MRIVRAGVIVGLLSVVSAPVSAQHRLTVSLRSDDVARGSNAVCAATTNRFIEQRDSARDELAREQDTVQVRIIDSNGAPIGSPAELNVRIGSGDFFVINEGDSVRNYVTGIRGLNNQRITVARAEAYARPLCSITPIALQGERRNIGVTHHDLFAGGEVSSALRTGSDGASATGMLGLHTRSYRTEDNPYEFPFGIVPNPEVRGRHPLAFFRWLSYPVELEELRVAVTVVGTADTLISSTSRREYAQAVLSPLTGARGNVSSVNVMYSPQHQYGDHSLAGVRLSVGATKSVWAAALQTADPAVSDTTTKDATLLSADARAHWVFINHVQDDGGNVFSFAMNLGLSYRAVVGDIAAPGNDEFLEATLGTTDREFWGPVFGLELKLRQVTAFAELLNLQVAGEDGDTRVESLEGWQPIIGFRFDAPMFTIYNVSD